MRLCPEGLLNRACKADFRSRWFEGRKGEDWVRVYPLRSHACGRFSFGLVSESQSTYAAPKGSERTKPSEIKAVIALSNVVFKVLTRT